jgi:Skp family chaperone for outer membrane proteins
MKRRIMISHRGPEARRGQYRALIDEIKNPWGLRLCASVPPCEILAAVCLVIACYSSAKSAEPFPLGLVNVDRILKSHKPLLEKLDPLKEEAKDLDAKVQVRQAELEAVGLQFRNAQPGTPDHQRLQIQLVKMQNDLQQFVANERQNLQRKEAMIFLALFKQLDAEIARYSKAQGLKLVIRQHETSLDENQPLTDIYKALNRVILYEDGLDITDEILKGLSSPSAAAAIPR